jgi:2-desacetyl-2-hydroxyethyl bacteriochlorophyllide A dehydrogenase
MAVLGVHVDGGMLGTIRVSRGKLHKSETLSLEQLALVETVAVGAHAVHRAAITAGDSVLVVGAGPIGQSVIASAQAEEARIAVLELRKDRLEFCRETAEGCHLLNPDKDLSEQLQKSFAGNLPTTVFDCTGNPRSMMASFEHVAHGGKLVFVGHFPGEITFHDPLFHGREMTLMASRNATAEDFQRVIGWMESGRLDVRNWITHRVGLPRFVETFPGWLDPKAGVFKGMVEWS